MSEYGDGILVAAAKAGANHAEANGADGVTRVAIVAALRHLLKPSKAIRVALIDGPWTKGHVEKWRAGIKAAIKELEG